MPDRKEAVAWQTEAEKGSALKTRVIRGFMRLRTAVEPSQTNKNRTSLYPSKQEGLPKQRWGKGLYSRQQGKQ